MYLFFLWDEGATGNRVHWASELNLTCVCKVLVRRHPDGTELRGRVVETEAYLGGEDKASHSAGGKRTERNMAMFMKPGTIYVYPIYGIYLCMNISSQGEACCSFIIKKFTNIVNKY